jgi:hypothetical protein
MNQAWTRPASGLKRAIRPVARSKLIPGQDAPPAAPPERPPIALHKAEMPTLIRHTAPMFLGPVFRIPRRVSRQPPRLVSHSEKQPVFVS